MRTKNNAKNTQMSIFSSVWFLTSRCPSDVLCSPCVRFARARQALFVTRVTGLLTYIGLDECMLGLRIAIFVFTAVCARRNVLFFYVALSLIFYKLVSFLPLLLWGHEEDVHTEDGRTLPRCSALLLTAYHKAFSYRYL